MYVAIRKVSHIENIEAEYVGTPALWRSLIGRSPFRTDMTPSFVLNRGRDASHYHDCRVGDGVKPRTGLQINRFKPSAAHDPGSDTEVLHFDIAPPYVRHRGDNA